MKAIIFDLDGTLAYPHYREKEWCNPNDWDWYLFVECMKDADIIWPIRDLVISSLVCTTEYLIIMTARPDFLRDMTKDWLHENGILYHELIMMDQASFEHMEKSRTDGDICQSAADWKERETKKLMKRYDIELAIDDRIENIRVFEKLGITTLHVRL